MIHQAKSNSQLLDEQVFSERLATAISALADILRSPAWCPLRAIIGLETQLDNPTRGGENGENYRIRASALISSASISAFRSNTKSRAFP